MQWLIDLVLETIRKDGLVVNRGDKIGEDFDITDFTLDNVWRDLDLSGIIPVNAHVVYATVTLRASTTGRYIQFRTRGFSTIRATARVRNEVANMLVDEDLQLFPDSAGFVEYRAFDAALTALNLTIKGWDF